MNGGINMDFIGCWLFGGDGPVIIQTLDLHVQGVHLGLGKHLVPGLSQGIHALAHLLQDLGLRVLHLRVTT